MYVKKGQKKVKKKCPKCIYNYGHKYSPSKTSAHIQYIQYNVILSTSVQTPIWSVFETTA